MAEVYPNRIAILAKLGYEKGTSPWILRDVRAERRQNASQKGCNRNGRMAQDKTTRKEAFHNMQGFFPELPRGERG